MISDQILQKYKNKKTYSEKVKKNCYFLETNPTAMMRFLENQVKERKMMKNIDHITTTDEQLRNDITNYIDKKLKKAMEEGKFCNCMIKHMSEEFLIKAGKFHKKYYCESHVEECNHTFNKEDFIQQCIDEYKNFIDFQ